LEAFKVHDIPAAVAKMESGSNATFAIYMQWLLACLQLPILTIYPALAVGKRQHWAVQRVAIPP
jgi:hypothetical protein